MKVNNLGESCTTGSTNTTAQTTLSSTVSSLSPPSETSSPMFTVPGEFTASDYSTPAIPICNSGGFNTSCVLSTLACGADTITFDFPASGSGTDGKQKVLIHKYGTTPCIDQPPQPPTGDCYPLYPHQTEDRKIKIKATVRDGCGQPLDGKPVYFKVIDPPDSSPYIQNPQPDDNEETKNNPPNDSDSGTLTTDHDTSANGGVVEAELTVTDEFGGDNYQIEARFQSQTDPVQATSGTLTAWKRAYIELGQMWKVGEFITRDSVANTNKVYVSNLNTFSAGDQVHVLSADNPSGEDNTIQSFDVPNKAIVLLNTLNFTYRSTVTTNTCDPAHSPPNFSPYCAKPPYSFIARKAGGAYDSQVTPSTLATAFDDTFVEWSNLPAISYLPSWPAIPFGQTSIPSFDQFISERTHFFFKNQLKKNHIFFVAGGKLSLFSTGYGLSKSDGTSPWVNYSWIFLDTIMNVFHVQNAVDNVSTHELTHQWNVNSGPPGHCTENAWMPLGGDPKCLMNEGRNRSLGVQRLHTNFPTAPKKDLYCIRGHKDDLYQDSCSWL